MRWLLTLLFSLLVSPLYGEERPSVTLASIQWEPYLGHDLPDEGFVSEVVRKAFEQVGVEVQFVYMPWARAFRETVEGRVNGVMGVYRNSEREKVLLFSDEAYAIAEWLISNTDISEGSEPLADKFKGQAVAVVNQSMQASDLAAEGVRLFPLPNHQRQVTLLLGNRIDTVLMPKEVFAFHLNKMTRQIEGKLPNTYHFTPFRSYPVYVAFSKAHPASAEQRVKLNRGLAAIKSSGLYQTILAKHQKQWVQAQ